VTLHAAGDRLNGMASNEFEGVDHGSDVSVIVVDAPPGRGPALHHHPYIETFVIQAGRVRFSVDGRTFEAGAGQVVVAAAESVHGFTTLEPDGARMVNIHSAPRFETTWV
jgi:quercetin dioxygenase-like cupin family protein